MSKIQNNSLGFSVLEALLILVIIGILGFTGWYVWHAKNNVTASLNSNHSVAPTYNKQTSKPTTQGSTITSSYKKYTSTFGKFSFTYPSSWKWSGSVGNGDPLLEGSNYSTELTGQEDFINFHSGPNDNVNDFGISIYVTNKPINYAFVPNYLNFGTTLKLDNDLSMWVSSKDNESEKQGPAVRLVKGNDYNVALSNGKYLVIGGSFIWEQRSTTTYTYEQQLTRPEFQEAEKLIKSVALN